MPKYLQHNNLQFALLQSMKNIDFNYDDCTEKTSQLYQ